MDKDFSLSTSKRDLSTLSTSLVHKDDMSMSNISSTLDLAGLNIHNNQSQAAKNSNQAVTLSTAGIRAVVYQLQALYLRTPVKLFRPSRFDYMAYVREVANKHDKIYLKPYRVRTHSSIGMLVNVLRKEGWRFIPDQVLPPLIANSATGLILYGTYLSSLDRFDKRHEEEKKQNQRSNYYYSPIDTWRAGLIAGAAQSLAAAPVDAIYTRLSAAEMLNGTHQNLWVYGLSKLKEVGLIGVFAGYGFSLIKDSVGFAFYFSVFEIVKTQGYNITYSTLLGYRKIRLSVSKKLANLGVHKETQQSDEEALKLENNRLIKILKSSFILLAGASAAFTLLAVQYPIAKVQKIHLSRLEALDVYNASKSTAYRPFIKLYYNSYIDTYNQVLKIKAKSKASWFQLSYKGFIRNALTTIPATSVGLLVFEIMRTKLSDSLDEESFGPGALDP
ncbi:uncharacterized protein AC631_01919 [Debaryomyces fabryi]|uniref:Mitochondrial thiamine pyrophosphate carrier 1 n=1 Tax=Debaryomyces fabryi TaxID=58627 RepID=A0A0V1Q1K2_9ASCO|nr:uncharacterized protein AC631_01919 [Debaryomyces fabryi]KSA02361.1 hypothetical protein AC631_01919 [Debaryomyces fabryi]CUM51581.1 unnamed protein product [Debaryomyces fabryi]